MGTQHGEQKEGWSEKLGMGAEAACSSRSSLSFLYLCLCSEEVAIQTQASHVKVGSGGP